MQGIFLPVFLILFAGEEKTVVCTLEVLERGLTVYELAYKDTYDIIFLKSNEVYIFGHKLKTV
jgi:hypothetical protein